MITLIIALLFIAALIAFVYIATEHGFRAAIAAFVALATGIGGAIAAFIHSFGSGATP